MGNKPNVESLELFNPSQATEKLFVEERWRQPFSSWNIKTREAKEKFIRDVVVPVPLADACIF